MRPDFQSNLGESAQWASAHSREGSEGRFLISQASKMQTDVSQTVDTARKLGGDLFGSVTSQAGVSWRRPAAKVESGDRAPNCGEKESPREDQR